MVHSLRPLAGTVLKCLVQPSVVETVLGLTESAHYKLILFVSRQFKILWCVQYMKSHSENLALGLVFLFGDFSCLSWASITCNCAEILCVGVRPCGSKLAIGIGHSWFWARFMAAQIRAINFAKNTAIYSVSAGFYQVNTRWGQGQIVSMASIVS